MLENGWETLEAYPGAGKPWLSRCVHCGARYPKMLSHVQDGLAGCRTCSGRDVTDEAARQVMRASSLEPLVPYPGSLEPWLCRCMRCEHVGRPTYAKVRQRGHQCWSCRSDRLSEALRLDSNEAVASMVEADLEPLVPYPGSGIPWKARCRRCETILDPGPTLHNIRNGQGGCGVCAIRGIDPTKPGYLYVVIHEQLHVLKWGIANLDYRLTQHEMQGWRLAARWDFAEVRDAWNFERQAKTWVRSKGIPRALSANEMKYGGHTETAYVSDLDPGELIAYLRQLIGDRPQR
jgi:hypothetical protein